MIVTRIKQVSIAVAGASLLALGTISTAQAQTTLESASKYVSPEEGGYAIFFDQFLGWRFQINSPFQVTEIGGYFGQWNDSSIFGAIAALDNTTGLPGGIPDYSIENLKGVTVFTPNSDPSSDTLTPLSVLLEPGNYGLIFGSLLYGATGESAMPYEEIINSPGSTYFMSTLDFDAPNRVWRDGGFSGARFIVKGEEVKQSVPENTPVLGLLALGSLSLFGIIKKQHSKGSLETQAPTN